VDISAKCVLLEQPLLEKSVFSVLNIYHRAFAEQGVTNMPASVVFAKQTVAFVPRVLFAVV